MRAYGIIAEYTPFHTGHRWQLEELRRRLVNRGTESAEAIENRLARARQEYGEATFYDYIIVNDDLAVAAQELTAIITAEHCRAADRMEYLENIWD